MMIGMTGRRVLLPFYHAVAPKQPEHIHPSMFHVRSPKLFEEDLRFLLRHARAVSINELNAIIDAGHQPNEPVFHITFDDGLSEFNKWAVPILKEYEVPATVFVNTDFVNNRGMFYRYIVALILSRTSQSSETRQRLLSATHEDLPWIMEVVSSSGIDLEAYLEDVRPYMTLDELKELQGDGMTIGSHTASHRWFKYLSLDEMRNETSRTFIWMDDNLGPNDRYFSFPFSDEDVPKEFFSWLYREVDCKLSFGISGLKNDIHRNHLHRIPMENSMQPVSAIVLKEYMKTILRAPFGRNRIRR